MDPKRYSVDAQVVAICAVLRTGAASPEWVQARARCSFSSSRTFRAALARAVGAGLVQIDPSNQQACMLTDAAAQVAWEELERARPPVRR